MWYSIEVIKGNLEFNLMNKLPFSVLANKIANSIQDPHNRFYFLCNSANNRRQVIASSNMFQIDREDQNHKIYD